MKLRIGSRIQGGFAIVLLFLIASVAVAVVMLDQIDTGFHDLEDATERMTLAGRLDAETASLRLRVNQYLVSREAEPLEQARQALERLNEDVAEAQAQAQGDEARAVFAGVEESLATYGEGLDRLETLTGERNGVVDGVLDRIGPEARKALTEIRTTALADDDAEAAAVAGGISEQLMLARLLVNKFLVENRPADAEAARTQIQGAVDSLADLERVVQNPRRRDLINQLQELMPAYGQGIRDIEDIIAQRNAVRDGTLAREGEEILRAARDLRRQAQEAQSVVNQTVNDSVDFGSTLTIVIGAAAVVLGALFAVLIGRSITNPITAMTEAMRRLAGGDKSLEIPARDRHDEVGDMAAAVQVFKENMIKADELAEAQKVEQAAKEKRAQVVDRLIAHFNEEATEALSVVTSAATEMESTASSMSATAEETSQQAAVVASSAQEAAANVETVASAAEEMNSSVEEITRQVDQASKITRTAVSDAEQTNARVGGLADAVGQINDVVNLISDIAEQTNLLALNATIEAARAGDAGKGFAVVAGEVKNLANQTGKATEQISDQINAVQKATAEAVDSIRGITGTINQIAEISQAIASAVEEQGAATREIARNVQEAAAGTNEVSNSITHVNQAATDTGAATQQVLGAAGNLARQAETLREQVDTFLTNIRTA